jgi:predicted ATPase/class 3 adenylate cyclase
LPAGTVTFLFTDIEGSTRLLSRLGEKYADLLADHHRLLRQAFLVRNGQEVDTQGDAFFVSFARASEAVEAAADAQRLLKQHTWPMQAEVRVRMGLHTGEPDLREEGYIGMDVHRAARLAHAGHGGQVLLSETTAALVRGELPAGVSLRDLGEHRLKDLSASERIYQLDIHGLEMDFAPLKAESQSHHNLPQQLSSFIGRGKEIDQVMSLLTSERLVTLIGVGGVGKTRLSIEVASQLSSQYPDGVWLIELAPLSDPALLSQTAARACGVSDDPGRPLQEVLVDFLCSRRMLLVLDNCEHLIDACAELVSAIMNGCEQVGILATSREALDVPGERPYHVPPLAVVEPEALPEISALRDIEAVRMFLDRAAIVQPSFALTAQNALAVAKICCKLDGIPLAIELAAARVRVLSVEQIAVRLDDRFRLLTGGQRGKLPRQQTLQATIDWSHQLLTEPERILFRRLSVFVGGWTLEAAEAICAGEIQELEAGFDPEEVLDLLTHLVDKSLVMKVELEGSARFRWLETVRQYALEKLLESGEASAVRDRHLEWFLKLAEEAEAGYYSPEQSAWIRRLEADHDNLRSAIEWSQQSEENLQAGLRLAGALSVFWQTRGYLSEGRLRLKSLLAYPAAQFPPATRARALAGAADLAYIQSDYAAARDLLDESLRIYKTLGAAGKQGEANAYLGLGDVATEVGDYDTAPGLLEQGLVIMRELNDRWGIANALRLLGWCAMRPGDYTQAKAYLEEALALLREIGNEYGTASALSGLGEAALRLGNYADADGLLSESLELRRRLGAKWGIAASLGSLAWAALRRGDHQRARKLLTESLRIRQEIGDVGGTAWCLEKLAEMAGLEGRFADQVRVYGTASALRESVDSVIDPADQAEYQETLRRAKAEIGQAAFVKSWAEGQSSSVEEAITIGVGNSAAV